MKHIISTRWLRIPNPSCSHYPHNVGKLIWTFCSLSKPKFLCSLSCHTCPPRLCSVLNLEQWPCFEQHAILSLMNTFPFGIFLSNHIRRCPNKKSNGIRVLYLIESGYHPALVVEPIMQSSTTHDCWANHVATPGNPRPIWLQHITCKAAPFVIGLLAFFDDGFVPRYRKV